MSARPCPLCGYDAAVAPTSGHAAGRAARSAGGASAPGLCPHCGLAPRDRSLARRARGPLTGLVAGLAALPRGAYYLATTPRVKRWLVPPLVLTAVAFLLVFWGLWELVVPLVRHVQDGATGALPLPEGWWKDALDWLLGTAVVKALANLAAWAVFAVVAYLAASLTFSLVYETISGPFLDEIHGRLEERWFERNPRDAIHRPTSLPPGRCGWLTVYAGLPALLALALFAALSGPLAWAFLVVGVPAPFLVAARIEPEYGRWLVWVARLEGGTLWVSLKAVAVAGLVLLAFLPVQLIPGVGYVIFAAAAGFTTALSLMDIPFSRRQWSLRQRISFLVHHLPAVIAFGVVSSLLFVIPLLGPVVMVPAASAGGLWLICRLDKDCLLEG